MNRTDRQTFCFNLFFISPLDGLISSLSFGFHSPFCSRGQANPSARRVKTTASAGPKSKRNTHDLEKNGRCDGRGHSFYCTVLHRTAPTKPRADSAPPSLATTSCSHHITFKTHRPTLLRAADRAATRTTREDGYGTERSIVLFIIYLFFFPSSDAPPPSKGEKKKNSKQNLICWCGKKKERCWIDKHKWMNDWFYLSCNK